VGRVLENSLQAGVSFCDKMGHMYVWDILTQLEHSKKRHSRVSKNFRLPPTNREKHYAGGKRKHVARGHYEAYSWGQGGDKP